MQMSNVCARADQPVRGGGQCVEIDNRVKMSQNAQNFRACGALHRLQTYSAPLTTLGSHGPKTSPKRGWVFRGCLLPFHKETHKGFCGGRFHGTFHSNVWDTTCKPANVFTSTTLLPHSTAVREVHEPSASSGHCARSMRALGLAW